MAKYSPASAICASYRRDIGEDRVAKIAHTICLDMRGFHPNYTNAHKEMRNLTEYEDIDKDSVAMFDVDKIRADFPVLSTTVNGKPLAYLDNGATAQKPLAVIERRWTAYTASAIPTSTAAPTI